ncbi:DNA topoisomerase I [Magnetococcus marinus MC-1]|uniref:DNA topoisomerase 1 n=1 Tax=Magnetococcus marinus (strain ATCC BAA-1437 / JCM 17883 / MC-1) TaxID=156889 RepID=A0LDV2_MAGMM|nr:type I DNA topoisomerase [Magnetococcus marinus]ABK46145.1 DNA topoisomerase I [Magnetococcus marinus MC-1]
MTAVVIVESPAKAKTINKFLGRGYKVVATYGHIRDLPSKNGSVDTEHGFAMKYSVPKDSTKRVDELAKAVKGAEQVLLATDPDREGEAISWHVYEVLNEKKLLENVQVKRVVFHEITKTAIQDAVAHARDVDMDMVNAQQARRALDYLVGFNLSPLLWRKVRRGLSAGRVQSVALRLVCEREAEIQAFEAREYWSITALAAQAAQSAPRPFEARLAVADGEKLSKFSIGDEAYAKRLIKAVEKRPLYVSEIEKKQSKRNPAPPFITSTLQQEASRKLGFSAKKTMTVAQRLYEGMEVPTADGGKETVGLISYMRTDSVNLANEAIESIRKQIEIRYGKEYLPKSPRKYKSSAKNAQEAHEAIRPTDVIRTPEMLREILEKDQFRLYELIWKRTVACQMAQAKIDKVAANLSVDSQDPNAAYRFRATGSSVAFAGFMKVYMEGKDEVSAQDREDDDDDNESILPPLEVGQQLEQKSLDARQHFTEPPPRYTEATLVKVLESYGIGRPSTYAPTMSTLQDRGYVKLDARKFYPEDVGMVVNSYLTKHFSTYVDYNFTANLEDQLDAVSRGEKSWVPLMEDFWQPFIQQITLKDETTSKEEVTTEQIDEPCPKCGAPLSIKLGRFGKFKACTGYPECKHTEPLNKEEEVSRPEPELTDIPCDKCGKPMLIKEGRYGKYYGCSGAPECKNNQPLNKPRDTGVACPSCGQGTFLEKKSRRGKIFYSCSNYPKCKQALWDEPLEIPCPKCQAPFVTKKVTKTRGTEHICVAEGCDYKEVVEAPIKTSKQ